VTGKRLLTLTALLALAAAPAMAQSDEALGLHGNKNYDWAQFKDMSEEKRACFAKFLTEEELAELQKGEKPYKPRLEQKAKQLNIFCSRK